MGLWAHFLMGFVLGNGYYTAS
ncbi:hypothetical protein NC652_008767 [Populus alba x Populus x berolinensis]|uniref:Uncharacterized protein n=1 Tax=Populus alba x Populus x berolinensis TaxID=444605 RepID=A0AAD6R7Q1_9ROSI|nr:hypothetical protein NC652_008767 [Populus alba x Populus x berolinensis]KAJ7003692.1 hypothetical protein NC653_008793 [Populus alba x Populus x berolinensis]